MLTVNAPLVLIMEGLLHIHITTVLEMKVEWIGRKAQEQCLKLLESIGQKPLRRINCVEQDQRYSKKERSNKDSGSPIAPPAPYPIRWVKLIQFSPVHRRLFCQHYSTCLDHAARHWWQGFSCSQCSIIGQTKEEREK